MLCGDAQLQQMCGGVVRCFSRNVEIQGMISEPWQRQSSRKVIKKISRCLSTLPDRFGGDEINGCMRDCLHQPKCSAAGNNKIYVRI
jgi:hypothetical protein